MAAPVNNMAATFATLVAASTSSLPSSSSPSASATTLAKVAQSSIKTPSCPRSILRIPAPAPVSWNPQSALSASQKSSLLTLYGPPGPKPTIRHHPSVAARRRQPRTISVGDRLPDARLGYLGRDGRVVSLSVANLTRHKKVVFVGVSGAFVPATAGSGGGFAEGFLQRAEEMRARGADTIACVSVNDTHVMRAWGERIGAGRTNKKMLMLSDGSGSFARAMGVSEDLSDTRDGFGFGVRSKRYSLVAVDGVVSAFFLEGGGAEEILSCL